MEPIIAYCGLTCTECPAYLATLTDDDAKRAETSAMWSKQYGVNIPPQAVNCTGCSSDGVRFGYCEKCEIRACATGRNLANCGYCDDFPCGKVEHVLNAVPAVKDLLTKIHAARG